MTPNRSSLLMAAAALLTVLHGCAGRETSVHGSGMVEMDEVDVASLEGGRVIRLAVDEGDSVRAGDTLAVLQRAELAAQVQAQLAQAERAAAQTREVITGPRREEIRFARAALATAEAELVLADKDLARALELARNQAIAEAEVDRARAGRDAARGRRDAARESLRILETGSRREDVVAAREAAEAERAQLSAARSRLGEMVLIAPAGGVVLLRNFDAGEVAQPGQPVVTLGDPEKLWVRVFIAAPEIGRVRVGAPAEIVATGFGKRTFAAHVMSVATQAEFTPRAALTEDERANIVFAVRLRVEPTGGALKAGLPVEVRITPAANP